MLVCSVCRRSFDGRFKVMVPPSTEAFDSIECARQAATLRGLDTAALTPVVLPTLSAEPWQSPVGPTPTAPRRGVAALAAMLLVPGQAALAGGVGLATAGSAAAIYLAARPAIQPSHSDAVNAMPAPTVPSSKPAVPATRPTARAPVRLATTRPPDVRARKLVVAGRSGRHVGYAVVRNVVPTGRATPGSSYSTSTDTQLVSRTIPVRGTAPVSRPTSAPVTKIASGSGPAQPTAPRSTPTPTPKPSPKPRPHVTLPSPSAAPSGATSKPSNPAASSATRQLASADTTPPKGKHPEPPAVQAAAAASPLQQLVGDDGQLPGDHGDGGQPADPPADGSGTAPAPDTGGHTVPTTP